MIDLFDEVAELHFPIAPSESTGSPEESEISVSLEAELAKELTELKKSRRKKHHRFQVVESGCNNIVFIKFMDALDANKFVIKVFEHMTQEVKKPRTRYSNRILPIEKTCFVSEDSIVSTITPMIERVFVTENETKRPFKFRVELKVRNNDKLDKDELKRKLVTVVGKGHFVDLKTPHKLLLVEVFGKAAGVAVIDFEAMDLYKSFNIRTVSLGFGLPLPPHPDEGKKPKKDRASSSTPAQPSLSEDQPANSSESREALEEDISEGPERMEESAPPQTEDGSDSDSDNGGISLF
jgi:tRNA acetyltransferase TAN1